MAAMSNPHLIASWIWVLITSSATILANQEQYHIQTDEGPERYFRYMTLSGQYRKEKRMEDGTVIGTYGWVDADGMLRLNDYIADNDGYRIVRTKDVYVGKDTPMSAALKVAKKAPASNNFITDRRYNKAITQNAIDYNVSPTSSSYLPPSSSYFPPPSSYLPPSSFYSQPSPKPSVPYYPSTFYDDPPSFRASTPIGANTQVVTPVPVATNIQTVTSSPTGINFQAETNVPSTTNVFSSGPRTPYVQILPNSIPPSPLSPLHVEGLSQIPSSTTEPPYHVPTSTIAPPTGLESTTPATVHITSSSKTTSSGYSSTVSPFISTTTQTTQSFTQNNESSLQYNSTPLPFVSTTYTPVTTNTPFYEAISTIPTPLASNSLDTSSYSGSPQYEHYGEKYREPIENPYAFQNGPTYPIDQNGHIFTGRKNYNDDRHYSPYDGFAITNDGFRYYLPRQYHEEHSPPGEHNKVGSFGYIDPFGIRRVIYYNADPEKGFLHRKNNRYVGFDATPYDPRPS